MKRIILDLTTSLDGFITGKNKEIDWITFDDEIGEELSKFADEIDTVFYGRISYEEYGNYNPSDDANQFEKDFYAQINTKNKYVFSSQAIALHGNDQLINGDIVNEIKKIKENAKKDIWLFGGAGLISTLLNLNLIDEIRIGINPVVIGSGTPLFREISERKKFELIKTKVYKSGVVGLCYRPVLDTD